MADEEDNEEGDRSFTRWLADVGDGDCEIELNRKLRELISKMQMEARVQNKTVNGKLALDLSFSCNETGVVTVGYGVKTKEPDPKRPGSIFWTTKGGNLTIEDPRQQRLPLREVPGGRAARDVNEGGETAAKEV